MFRFAMKSAICGGLTACLASLLATVPAAGAPAPPPPARVWEEALVMPTYELEPPDPNPVFVFGPARRKSIYPYTMLDSLTNRRVTKSYQAVYLENEYLKVMVLPELGGKLWMIFDKTANRDALYTNHVVKYGRVATRGAWTSGGIEWNFPDGHSVSTVSPIDYALRAEPDGSATVIVGDTERIQRSQWAVIIRLRPGRKVVETEVRLNNRREVPGRYWYWANAAAKATEETRFIYPMREGYAHDVFPVFNFPIHEGVDVGLYRQIPNALSLFARNSYRDFTCVYQEKSDWGVVHVADHRIVSGRKIFTWGAADSGNIWIEKLTDNDGQYMEFQIGRLETQGDRQFIAPHYVDHFTHYWFPVNRLGGLSEANTEGALRVALGKGGVRIAANVNARQDDATLAVEAGGRQIHSRRVSLSPAEPFAAEVALPPEAAGKPVTVRITARDGRELIRYATDTPIDGNPEFRPATRPATDPPVSTSAEQAYLEGLDAEMRGGTLAARAACQKALERDPGFSPAHVSLGLSYYRTGDYDQAAGHLEAALVRNPASGDAHYYLGLVRRAQGRDFEAAQQLLWAVRAGYCESASRYLLGEMALAAGRTGEALEHLGQAVLLDPRDLKGRTVLAMAERLAKRLDGAQSRIDAVVGEMPIDYLALSEQYQINRARGREPEATRVHAELWRLLAREPDSVLELAFDYLACGRTTEASDVLDEGLKRKPYPMFAYTLGYLYGVRGDRARAAALYEQGSKGDPGFVFPHRLEEIAVLRAARKANPQDGRAAYYLGNALASKHRAEEAVAAWRDAVRLDASNAVAHRNLGLALAERPAARAEAVAAYERAIRLAPDDYHLYLELDRLFATMKAHERRVRLLEAAPAGARSRPVVIQALAAAYADVGRFAEAVRLLEVPRFNAREGDMSALMIYRQAQWGLARNHQKAGRHEQAAAAILQAAEYPRNLDVGRPPIDATVREWVEAARELEAAGKPAEAEPLWRKAADAVLELPTVESAEQAARYPEAWAEGRKYKAIALERMGRAKEAEKYKTAP